MKLAFRMLAAGLMGNSAAKPVASNVSISGTTTEGQTLTGSYTYSDNEGNPEGTSTYRWLRSDVAISAATSITYVLQAADIGHAIKFEVTPVSSVAPTTGTPVQSSATAAIAGVEQHYLPFVDSTTDFGWVSGILAGVTDTYTIAIKVAALMDGAATSEPAYTSAGGAGGSANTQMRYDAIARTGASGSQGYWLGYGDSGVRYFTQTPASLTAGAKVFVIKRTATQAKLRVIKCSDGTVEFSADLSSTVLKPTTIAIGAMCSVAGAYNAGAANIQFISEVLTDVENSDAELIAWAQADDARPHLTGIRDYWAASRAVSGTIPDLGSDNLTLALTGPVAGDLVAL